MRLAIARFSAYGFLKNQRYFEPFLALALLSWGASFAQIGLLVGLRELVRNLFEVPSGAVADLWGRRRAMVLAFSVYPLGVALMPLGGQEHPWLWGVAMGCLGLGDAFRSGTHKALVFAWLQQQGRAAERTKVYGYTRSWSRLGSAASIPLGVGLLLVTKDYAWTFWATCVPWTLDLINLATYPRELEGAREERRARGVGRHLLAALREVLGRRRLRRLLLDAAAFEGVHKATKEYLAPALLVGLGMGELDLGAAGVGASFVGAVYFATHLLGAAASRRAYRVEAWLGGGDEALARLGAGLVGAMALAAAGAWVPALTAAGLVAAAWLHDLFRPVLVGRIDAESQAVGKATVLSLESQGSSLTAVLLAPAVGLAVDQARALASGRGLWAVGLVGGLVALSLLRPRGGARRR